MATKPYNIEDDKPMMLAEPPMVYGSNEAVLLRLEEEIMRQPLEIKERLLTFLQDTIAAVKAKTKKTTKKKAMTWGEIAKTLPPMPDFLSNTRGFTHEFTKEEIEADPRLEHILRKHCGY